MDIHRRMGVTHKDGTPKSSTELTNADLTRVLAGFWSITCLPESRVAAQLRQTHAHQAAMMGRWSCEQIFVLIREIAPEEVSEDGLDAYLDGMFYNLNGGRHLGGLNPVTGTTDQWHKVMLASCYRYDQIVRRLLGEKGKRYGVRYWPHNHRRNLAELEAEEVYSPA